MNHSKKKYLNIYLTKFPENINVIKYVFNLALKNLRIYLQLNQLASALNCY